MSPQYGKWLLRLSRWTESTRYGTAIGPEGFSVTMKKCAADDANNEYLHIPYRGIKYPLLAYD